MVRQAHEGTYMAQKMKVACAKISTILRNYCPKCTFDPLFLLVFSVLQMIGYSCHGRIITLVTCHIKLEIENHNYWIKGDMAVKHVWMYVRPLWNCPIAKTVINSVNFLWRAKHVLTWHCHLFWTTGSIKLDTKLCCVWLSFQPFIENCTEIWQT